MTDTLPEIYPTLATEPRTNYSSMIASFKEIVDGFSVPGAKGYNLMNATIPADIWNRDHPGQSRLPEEPAPLGPNPTRLQVLEYNIELDIYRKAHALYIKIKAAFIKACGPTIAEELKIPGENHRTQELHVLMARVHENYGTLNQTDIDTLQSSLDHWDLNATFEQNCNRRAYTYLLLNSGGIEIKAYQQFRDLDKAIHDAGLIAIGDCIQRYKYATARALQTFDGAKKFIADQMPYLPTTAGGAHVNSATAAESPAAMEARLQALIATSIASSIAALSVTPGGSGGGGGRGGGGRGGGGGGGGGRNGGRNGGRGAGRGAGGGATGPYCFVHGYTGHAGSACRTMLSAPPGIYDQRMIDATAPCKINGIQGHL